MIYYHSENIIHDLALNFVDKLERELFENDPFLLMKTLTDFGMTSKLNFFIDDFINIIETINQNPNMAEKFKVQTIDANTLQ